jgi:hypothetical protein
MQRQGDEIEEIRISIERLRALLESLVVRGLRACGREELVQLQAYAEEMDRSGAGHIASLLNELQQQIEKNDRAAARVLLNAQTSVRLLERLLTLRVAGARLGSAVAAAAAAPSDGEADEQDDEDAED